MATRYNIKTSQIILTTEWLELTATGSLHTSMLVYNPEADVHIVRGHDVPTEDNYYLMPKGSTIEFDLAAIGKTWMRATTTSKIYQMGS